MAAIESSFSVQDQFTVRLPSFQLPIMDCHSRHSSLGERPDRLERPASALARGVQITEFTDSKVNPDPVVVEDTDMLLEDFLSPRKLRDLTGVDNLKDVHFMEMKVDTRDTSLGNFGAHLPNLSQLKLSNSIITSVRDLGSSLNHLRVLWMARCGLEDIDGVSTMNNLRELYLAYNEVYDISPCSMLENLKILDLEGNNVDEISQVECLALCPSLTNLTLEGNPVCVTPSPDHAAADYDYREAVKSRVPHVKYLDDELLEEPAVDAKRTHSVFDEDWKLIEELMEDGTVLGEVEDSDQNFSRPLTAIRPTTGYRPGSALKQRLTTATRPGSSRFRTALSPGSGSRPGSARPGSARPGSARPGTSGRSSGEELNVTEDSSELTLGGVVCGNPSKALKSRQRHLLNEPDNIALNKLYKQHSQNPHAKPVPSRPADNLGDDDHLHTLLSEVEAWKKEHQIRRKELDAEKAPQILRIDHDAAVDVGSSDEESVDSDLEDAASLQQSPYTYGQSERQPSADSASRYKATGSAKGTVVKTGSLIRSRRYHIPLTQTHEDTPVDSASLRRRHLEYDDSFEAREDLSPMSQSPEHRGVNTEQPGRSPLRSPSPLRTSQDIETRPISGPAVGISTKGKFRLGPVVDKNQPKVIDRLNPIVRSSIHSPEQRVADGLRAGTAHVGILTPTQTPSLRGFRKVQLTGVPLLPSKMPNKFK